MRVIKLVKHLPQEELEHFYTKERDSRIKERLRTILKAYNGKKVIEIMPIVERCESTVRDWIRLWNEGGIENLSPKFTGGPKPKISKEIWDKIIAHTENKSMDITDVRIYIKKEHGVEYAYNGVWKHLRRRDRKGRRKTTYGKPYIVNNKRPKDAEDILKKG